MLVKPIKMKDSFLAAFLSKFLCQVSLMSQLESFGVGLPFPLIYHDGSTILFFVLIFWLLLYSHYIFISSRYILETDTCMSVVTVLGKVLLLKF